jgi:hypothetical protein
MLVYTKSGYDDHFAFEDLEIVRNSSYRKWKQVSDC